MHTDNAINYIESGQSVIPEKKEYRKLILGPFLLTVMLGVGPGVLLKGPWLVAMILMVVISVAALIMTFVLSKNQLTTQIQLILKIILYISWLLTIYLVQFMYYIMQYKSGLWLIVLYVPPLLTPLILGWKISREINRDSPLTRNKVVKHKVRLGVSFSGIAGMSLGAMLFNDIEQNTAITILLIILSIINTVLSMGLLSIQRLYYLGKLKQQGIIM